MDELKAIFGTAFTLQDEHMADAHAYYWFRSHSESGRLFGIRKSAITEKELRLLKLTYSLTQQPKQLLSLNQQAWMALLYDGKTDIPLVLESPFTQFLFFQFKASMTDVDAFEEAISGYFPESFTILWPNDQFAVLVVSVHPSSLPSGEDLVEQLTTDFMVTAKVYVGTAFQEIKHAPFLFEKDMQAFQIVQRKQPNKFVFHYTEAIPLLLKDEPLHELDPFFHTFFSYIEEDPDCQSQLETLFNHNLNLSTTAKALYMHRNSLHYRLDKFKEHTGLDPRVFRDAFYIQLGLTAVK